VLSVPRSVDCALLLVAVSSSSRETSAFVGGLTQSAVEAGLSVVKVTRGGVITWPSVKPVIRTSGGDSVEEWLDRSATQQLYEYRRPLAECGAANWTACADDDCASVEGESPSSGRKLRQLERFPTGPNPDASDNAASTNEDRRSSLSELKVSALSELDATVAEVVVGVLETASDSSDICRNDRFSVFSDSDPLTTIADVDEGGVDVVALSSETTCAGEAINEDDGGELKTDGYCCVWSKDDDDKVELGDDGVAEGTSDKTPELRVDVLDRACSSADEFTSAGPGQ